MRWSSNLFSHILKTSSDRDSATSLGKLFQGPTLLSVKKKNLLLRKNHCLGTICTHCHLFFHVVPCEERASVLIIATLEYCDKVSPKPSPEWKALTDSVLLHRLVSPALWPFAAFLLAFSSQNWTEHSALEQPDEWDDNISLSMQKVVPSLKPHPSALTLGSVGA